VGGWGGGHINAAPSVICWLMFSLCYLATFQLNSAFIKQHVAIAMHVDRPTQWKIFL